MSKRLTTNLDGQYHITHNWEERNDWKDENKEFLATQKLGLLEDVEKELGIDLITLFKALKDGVYIKRKNRFDEWYLDKDKQEVASFSFRFNEIYIEEECEYQYPYKLSDYGKTWALTKEELL